MIKTNTCSECGSNDGHEVWCNLNTDDTFKRTPEMDAIEAKRIAQKATNTARFNEVVALLGNAPWRLWEKVTRNPELTTAQIAEEIKAGKL